MEKDKVISQLVKLGSYLIVGGGATIVEWVCYRIFSHAIGMQYLVATTLAIVISTFSNWLFGRLLTFRHAEKQNLWKEIGKIYVISIVGLLLNLLLMWLLHGVLGMWDMLAKMLATGIVFLYNYSIRIFFVYKK